jgi:DNA ligase-1
MEYSALVSVYDDLAAESGTHAKRDLLADLFRETDPDLLPAVVRLSRGRVFPPWDSRSLGVSSSLTLDAIATATGVPADDVEDRWREAGDLGDAAASALVDRTQQPLVPRTLTVRDVHDTLRELAGYAGEGSQSRRVDALAGLVSDASPDEARYLVRTVVGAMRLGVGEGIVRDALADAFLDGSQDAVDAVERAAEVTNDYALVAERARADGRDGLAALDVELFRPIKPMLAGTAESLGGALDALGDDEGRALVETKYDGVRAKCHRRGDEVRVFTRRLEDVTAQFPDVEAAVRDHLDATEFVVEAEVVGRDPDTGDPVPFQELSRRIKRKYDVDELVEAVPVTVHLFDCLVLEGESLLDRPLRERLAELAAVLDPDPGRIERAANVRTADVDAAETFYGDALAAGHEGVMVKNLDATYQPGSRVGYQRKVKPTMEPLDLVVTRAKWSEGRKSDFLGRPYLACRTADGSLAEVGRMHTGFTDDDLAALTDRLEPLVRAVDGREALLEPAVVLEVEYEEIQASPTYDSGYALRFPRFLAIRDDLAPEDADTLARVEELYEGQD